MAVTRRSPLPPSAGTTEASSITRRSSTSELGYIARGGVAPFHRSSRTQVGPHARTHAGWWWWCWWSPRFLPRPQARRVCDVGLTEVNAARSRAFDEPPLCVFRHKNHRSPLSAPLTRQWIMDKSPRVPRPPHCPPKGRVVGVRPRDSLAGPRGHRDDRPTGPFGPHPGPQVRTSTHAG
jgi:hypothetical protein